MTDPKRKLAAIMFTDIAGFTSLMGKDHAGAMELLSSNRTLHRTMIERHGGKWIKEMGDGILARFQSAYSAVKCAIDIQLNADLVLKGKLRIGIHLGDISISDNDVFGDGVNIASRIESAADPGGIFISESVRHAIRNNPEIKTEFIGSLYFKNVSDPINTFAIVVEGLPKPESKKAKTLLKNKGSFRGMRWIYLMVFILLLSSAWYYFGYFQINNRQRVESLAVLPFDNLTGDANMDLLIAGMHDQLITTLSQLNSLRITSRTSTLKYVKRDKSMQEIAEELEVDALIEASVLKVGDSVRINVQLIQAFPKEKHLWAKVFDKSFINILGLFNEVTRSVTDEINLTINADEESILSSSRAVNPEAFEAYMKGKIQSEILSEEGFDMAETYLFKSIELDPNYAPAYAAMAFVWIGRLQMKLTGMEAVPRIYEYNQKALELDPDYPDAHYLKGLMSGQGWNWEESVTAFQKAIEGNPNHALAHAFYSHMLMMIQKHDEAVEQCNTALALDPNNDLLLALCAGVFLNTDHEERGGLLIEKAYAMNPNSRLTNGMRNGLLLKQGKHEEVLMTLLQNLNADSTMSKIVMQEFKQKGFEKANAKLAALLEQRGGQNLINQAFALAGFYDKGEDSEKAIQWLEFAHDHHHPDMGYAFWPKFFPSLKKDSIYRDRYWALANKMGLPTGE